MRSEALGHQDLPHAAWVAEVLLVPRQQCIGGPDHSLHFEDLTEPPNLVACPQPRQQLAARLGGRAGFEKLGAAMPICIDSPDHRLSIGSPAGRLEETHT
ncbi:MAG: hypothetical protein KA274_20155, partial [Ilumatobacteraceae bacterium]|nr:hypothetical protein [Ilumatobacteraceae bacterium]